MATADDSSSFEPVSQDQYEEETRDTQVVLFEDAAGGMEVQTLKPLEIVKEAQARGVPSILRGSIDQEEMVGDGDETGIGPFMRSAIAPNVVSHVAFWDEEPEDEDAVAELAAGRPVDDDAPTFDLSVLDQGDIKRMVKGVMGQDPDADQDDEGND